MMDTFKLNRVAETLQTKCSSDNLVQVSTQNELKFACVSDIHLFHPRVLTEWILRSLDNAFKDNEETGELDYILIPGDIFDKISQLPTQAVSMVHGWITDFLSMCQRRNIKVRILEGTPSHDRKQSQLFVDINKTLGERAADLRYVDTLLVDYEEVHDFHILYIPDEFHHDPDYIWDLVQEQLRLKGIDKVQVAMFHGYMDFNLPPVVKAMSFDHKRYDTIVEWFGTVGHVHHPKHWGRWFIQGSLECLKFGEEEKKGHYRITVKPESGTIMHKFIENTLRMTQKDLHLEGDDYKEAYQFCKKEADKILAKPDAMHFKLNGSLRLNMDTDLYNAGILETLKKEYPTIFWDKKVIRPGQEKETDESMDLSLEEIVQVSPLNIKSMMEEQLVKQDKGTPEQLAHALTLLEEFI